MSLKIIVRLVLLNVLFLSYINSVYAYQWGNLEWAPWSSLEEKYDSNITYAHSDTFSDFITALQLGLVGEYEGKNSKARFKAAIKQELFSRYSDFNNLSEYFDGIYEKDFSSRDSFRIENHFLHAEDPHNFVDQFGRLAGRYEYNQNALDSSWTHAFNNQLDLQFKFKNHYYSPDADNVLTSVQYKPGLDLGYSFNSQIKSSLFYDYSQRDFSPGSPLRKHTTGVGLKYNFNPKFFLEGRTGADFIQPALGRNLVRPLYMIALNDQKDSRTLYRISYTKQFQDTPYSQYFFNSWQATIDWKKDVLKRLSAYLTLFTGGGVYQSVGFKEHLNGANGGFIFHMTKNSDLRLGYLFSTNDSNAPSSSYQKHVSILEVIIKF